jgi:hypothetical protein
MTVDRFRHHGTPPVIRVQVSWREFRRAGDDAEGVAWGVDAAAFLGEVKVPVGVEVAVADERAEFRDGFGCVEFPSARL